MSGLGFGFGLTGEGLGVGAGGAGFGIGLGVGVGIGSFAGSGRVSAILATQAFCILQYSISAASIPKMARPSRIAFWILSASTRISARMVFDPFSGHAPVIGSGSFTSATHLGSENLSVCVAAHARAKAKFIPRIPNSSRH